MGHQNEVGIPCGQGESWWALGHTAVIEGDFNEEGIIPISYVAENAAMIIGDNSSVAWR